MEKNAQVEKSDMLYNYAPWTGLLKWRDRGQFLEMKMGKQLKIYLRVSTHYLINAQVEKGDMLSNDAPCGGLEANQLEVICTNLAW